MPNMHFFFLQTLQQEGNDKIPHSINFVGFNEKGKAKSDLYSSISFSSLTVASTYYTVMTTGTPRLRDLLT